MILLNSLLDRSLLLSLLGISLHLGLLGLLKLCLSGKVSCLLCFSLLLELNGDCLVTELLSLGSFSFSISFSDCLSLLELLILDLLQEMLSMLLLSSVSSILVLKLK